jgi:lipoate-protein ligase A
MAGRLLHATLGDPYSNVALEEVLFTGLRVPTLRVWSNQRCVVVGRAQLAAAETDVGYCGRNSVPVVRRFTAGGAVYNGPGNMNWSFLVPRAQEGGRPALGDANGVFSSFAAKVVQALRSCGAECEFRPPNAIFDGRGKVSGMAAYISSRGVLCHGTLLVAADLAEVESLTRPRGGALLPRYPRSRAARVSNCGVDPARFAAELARASGFGPEAGGLTAAEEESVGSLVASKYSRDSWNLGDPFALDEL